MNRLVEVFCATQRHQKTEKKTKKQKNETQTKVRMATVGILGYKKQKTGMEEQSCLLQPYYHVELLSLQPMFLPKPFD